MTDRRPRRLISSGWEHACFWLVQVVQLSVAVVMLAFVRELAILLNDFGDPRYFDLPTQVTIIAAANRVWLLGGAMALQVLQVYGLIYQKGRPPWTVVYSLSLA